MKSFIKNILLFTLGLIPLNILLFFIVHEKYFKIYEKVSLEPDTYILSDSHGLLLGDLAEYGIYNFSAGSDSYFDIKRKISYLINNSDVDTIIISADDHMLSPYRESKNNIDRSVYFSGLSEFHSLYDYFKFKFFKRYLVFLNPKSRDIILSYIKSELFYNSSFKKSKGFAERSENEKVLHVENRINIQFPSNKKSNSLLTALNEIIEICKKNHVKLIGLKFPLTKTYLKKMNDKSYSIDSVFEKHSLQILDFKALYINYDSLFADPDHLNKLGGKIFTDTLIEALKPALPEKYNFNARVEFKESFTSSLQNPSLQQKILKDQLKCQ